MKIKLMEAKDRVLSVLDTRTKLYVATAVVGVLLIASVGGIALALTKEPQVVLTVEDQRQLDKEIKFNDFVLTDNEIRIAYGHKDFDFSSLVAGDYDLVEAVGFDPYKEGVQDIAIEVTVGTKKLSKEFSVEVLTKDSDEEETLIDEIEFDEEVVQAVKEGKTTNDKVVVKDNGLQDKVTPPKADKPSDDGSSSNIKPGNGTGNGVTTKPDPKPETPKPVDPKPEPKPDPKPESKPEEPKVTYGAPYNVDTSIAFTTSTVDDESQLVGTSGVRTPGKNGISRTVVREKFIDGKSAGTEVVTATTTIVSPVNQVNWKGTKTPPVAAPTANFSEGANSWYTTRSAANNAGYSILDSIIFGDDTYKGVTRFHVSNIQTSDGSSIYGIFLVAGKDYAYLGLHGVRGYSISGTQVIPK